jgi:hypothetical protein
LELHPVIAQDAIASTMVHTYRIGPLYRCRADPASNRYAAMAMLVMSDHGPVSPLRDIQRPQ